jgi:protoporphyrinogen oxidase
MPSHDAAPPFVVLGAGPAGLAAAYKLSQRGWRDVTVFERAGRIGGNAGSFVIDGIPVDFGSHRLHPVCPAPILADLRAMLGDDLLDRPRHGRIRLRGRWVHFPLRPFELAFELPPAFLAGALGDVVRKRFAATPAEPTFASVLERGLGRTICRDFYFPYAKKIWGVEPAALDAEQAKRRVSSGTAGAMVRRVLGALPGLKKPGTGRFFYPRRGYGQISDAYCAAATAAGVTVHLGTRVTGVAVEGNRVSHVEVETDGRQRRIAAAHVLSTIPIAPLAQLVRADGRLQAPPLDAAASLRHRAMLLVYLTLDAERFTEFDAHYFPESAIHITRLSEPKNYSQTKQPGVTVLCAELPCDATDAVWAMDDGALGALVAGDLERAGLGPLPTVRAVTVRRLSHAYPLYTRGYRQSFDAVDAWLSRIDGLITFGRQGLFVHDNTHHTMAMAYALVDSFRADGSWDREAWHAARKGFESHVVED